MTATMTVAPAPTTAAASPYGHRRGRMRAIRGTTAVVGLDIGSSSISAVKSVSSRKRSRLTNFGRADLPSGAVVGGMIHDEDAVIGALRQLWRDCRFGSRTVALGVANPQVVVREITIANLSPAQRKRALPFQVDEVLPFPADEAILDFYPLARPDKNAEHVTGLVSAVPEQCVLDQVRMTERAGLRVASVDLSCYATLRAAASLAAGTEVVVDVGANTTTIVVHTDGMPRMVRSLMRGGDGVTAAIATQADVPPEQAEEIKRRVGVRQDSEDEHDPAMVAEALGPIVSEIRRSIRFQASVSPAQPVTRVSLTGGSAHLPGLADWLTETLDVTCMVANPLQRVELAYHQEFAVTMARYGPSAVAAIGLTLGASR